MEGPHMSSGTEFSRWSSLSSRIGALIAVLLIVSALATATYSASVAHTTASQSSEAAMANAHESTGVLISQAYDEQQRFRATMLEQRKSQLKNIASPLLTAFDQLRAMAAAGTITTAQAKEAGMNLIRTEFYGNKDYFFLYNPKYYIIAGPPALNKIIGVDRSKVQDSAGKFYPRDIVDVAMKNGSGYTDYLFPRLGSTVASPKLSYSYYYAPWNWILATGVYIDDIDQAAAAQLEKEKVALGQSFDQINFSESGLLFVLDSDGKIVVQPSGGNVAEAMNSDWGRSLALTLISQAPKASGKTAHFNDLAEFRGQNESWSVDVSSFGKLGWTLVSAVPQAEVEAPGNASAIQQGLLSFAVLILGLLVGLLSSRRLVRPVEQMTHAALALEKGAFDPVMLDSAATRKDEVGVLARAFQKMGAEIVQRESKLREEVKKLTVMIDRGKAQADASAITETDYFRDLADRARDIRNDFSRVEKP